MFGGRKTYRKTHRVKSRRGGMVGFSKVNGHLVASQIFSPETRLAMINAARHHGGKKTRRVKSRRGGMLVFRNVNGHLVRDLTQPRQDMK